MKSIPAQPEKSPQETDDSKPNAAEPETGNMAEVIRGKVQRGEMSPQEAKRLFEDIHKQLDA
jgi:hypothetical protein